MKFCVQTKYLSLAYVAALAVLLCFCKASSLTETEALLKWKETLVNQSIVQSWVIPASNSSNSTTPSPCRWSGIVCNDAGSVTEINLANTGLAGTLHDLDFSSFPNLLRFDVYELDVSRNNMTGGIDPRLFPDDKNQPMTGLLGLKNFLLQDNMLSGRIPEEIGNCKLLTLLALDGNFLSGPIPSSLGNLSDLAVLAVASNQLSGEIPANIGTLSKLTDLHLFINKLSGLPPQVCKGGKLINFTASFNHFSGPIPTSLKSCSSLYRVRLESNELTGDLEQDFGIYPNLTYIDLSYNRLQGEVSPKWGKCQKLTLLGLGGNSIVGKIPAEIGSLSQLVVLDLSSNQLSGEIPAQIGNLTELSTLSLNGNDISGPIPEEIGALLNLDSLDLSMNRLSGPIPKQIGELRDLRSLSLSQNNLNGTIPFQIGNLVGLQDLLDLSYNSLTGEIPAQLEKLTSLQSMNLSHNNLSGEIPASLSSMLSLVAVNLSYNNLEGPLPDGSVFSSNQSSAFANNKDLCGKVQGLRPCNALSTDKGGGNKDNKLVVAIVAPLASVLFILFAIIGIFVFTRWRKSRRESRVGFISRRDNPFSVWYFNGRVVYDDILKATDEFDDMYCIGEGGSGKVYKAEMQGGQVFMNPGSPMPPIAKGWATPYDRNIIAFKDLVPNVASKDTIDLDDQ
ncbi:hypothetical protein CUMW_151100 [Citrus unshiu]|uniref:non-specific serine/threonine protein kinase n=1 Tax=Citrus unshiu TaxID=55188 RepID=A0A2H5PMX8_CITUN|nr:hypothetical protein CUMW_151100 [Citrus unshiu]